MISALSAKGRGYAIAVSAIGLGTIVEMTATLGLFWEVLPAMYWAQVTGSYFLMLGAVGAIYQGQNIANALPGQRAERKGGTTDEP